MREFSKEFPWEIAVLSVILIANRAMARASWRYPLLFWVIQGADLLAIVYLALVGMKGLEGVPAMNWIVCGLLAFHIIQNFGLRAKARAEASSEENFRADIRRTRDNFRAPQE
jgi:hypothetical protein